MTDPSTGPLPYARPAPKSRWYFREWFIMTIISIAVVPGFAFFICSMALIAGVRETLVYLIFAASGAIFFPCAAFLLYALLHDYRPRPSINSTSPATTSASAPSTPAPPPLPSPPNSPPPPNR